MPFSPTDRFFREDAALLEWLAKQEPEEVLDPGIPIVDAHHHLWASTEARPILGTGTYLFRHMMDDILGSGHDVRQTVFVQCRAMYASEADEPDAKLRHAATRSAPPQPPPHLLPSFLSF